MADILTAVVPVAGKGKRLGRLGDLFNKAELPILNIPLLHYNLDILASAGIKKVIFIVAPGSEAFQARVTGLAKREHPGMAVEFIVQERPRGIGHAVLLSRDEVRGDFIVLLGDTLFFVDSLQPGIDALVKGRAAAVLSVREEADPDVIRKECTVDLDSSGHVTRIIEKPREPLSRIKPCGIYFFRPLIFDILAGMPPSPLKGEIEITESIQQLIERGESVKTARTVEMDVNITSERDYIDANLLALDRYNGGNSLVDADAQVADSAGIRHSVIGEGVRVLQGARIRDSVVLPHAVVPGNAVFDHAVILPGKGA